MGGGENPPSDAHYIIRDNQVVEFKVLFCGEALEVTIFGKLVLPAHAPVSYYSGGNFIGFFCRTWNCLWRELVTFNQRCLHGIRAQVQLAVASVWLQPHMHSRFEVWWLSWMLICTRPSQRQFFFFSCFPIITSYHWSILNGQNMAEQIF